MCVRNVTQVLARSFAKYVDLFRVWLLLNTYPETRAPYMNFLHCLPIATPIVLAVYWTMEELSIHYPEIF